MPILVLVAASAIALSLPLVWWSATAKGPNTLPKGRIDYVRGDVTDARQLMLQRSSGERVGMPLLRSFGTTLRRISPVGWIDSTRRRLVLAGNTRDFAVERTLVAKTLLGLLGAAAPLVAQLGGGTMRVVLAAVFGTVGFALPELMLHSRGQARQKLIQQELPDTLDQVRMSVEAGLGFEAALARVAGTGSGPLSEELNRTLRETRLGVSRAEALQNLAERTAVDDLDSFVFAVVQSAAYGLPIGQVLRVQSDELRGKRRDRAEERALKIPILLIFPMAFCIFPVLMIVLMAPAGLKIARELGGAL
jgi:tight adherence protein C